MAIHLRFFERRNGDILLPPDDETPCPRDCLLREANTLAEVDRLQRRLQQQTYERCQRELLRDEDAFAEARERVRSDLTTKLASAATSEYEREFLRLYLQLRDDKRDKYRSRFMCDRAYLLARENDERKSANELIEKLDL
jgi:hypothetical protein